PRGTRWAHREGAADLALERLLFCPRVSAAGNAPVPDADLRSGRADRRFHRPGERRCDALLRRPALGVRSGALRRGRGVEFSTFAAPGGRARRRRALARRARRGLLPFPAARRGIEERRCPWTVPLSRSRSPRWRSRRPAATRPAASTGTPTWGPFACRRRCSPTRRR